MSEKELISSFNIVMYIQVCDATTECFYTEISLDLILKISYLLRSVWVTLGLGQQPEHLEI